MLVGEFTQVRTNMRAFGADTLKPTLLIGSPWINLLQRSALADSSGMSKKTLVTSYKDKKGKRKVTGKPKELKQSQEYPPAFGQAVYQSFMATKPDVHTWNLPDYDVDVTDDERDTWPDALNGLQPAQLFHVATTFKEP